MTRVQSVNVDGTPQEYDLVAKHFPKDTRNASRLSPEQWEKHLENMASLGVLANQAIEFEYKKNLTEGKTGIVQPDLISSKNIEESLLNVVTSPDTPKKTLLAIGKTMDKISGLKNSVSAELIKHQEEIRSLHGSVESVTTLGSNGKSNGSTSSFIIFEAKSSSEPLKLFPSSKKSMLEEKNIEPEVKPIEIPKEVSKEPERARPKLIDTKSVHKTSEEFIEQEKKTLNVDPIPVAVPEVSSKPEITSFITKKQIKPETTKTPPKEKKTEIKKTEVKPPTVVTPAKAEKSGKLDKPQPKPKLTLASQTASPSTSPAAKITSSTSSLSIKRKKFKSAKPPNILVYSDSLVTRDNVIKTLNDILEKDMYTIYPLTVQQIKAQAWMENTTLLVVCGSVTGDFSAILLDYFFNGGKMLCLCSDLLHLVLPTYQTAEVCLNVFN